MRKIFVCVATLFFGCGEDNTIRLDAEDVVVSTPEDTPISATVPVDTNRSVNVRTTSGPSNGTVASVGTGEGTQWTYTPEANFNGTDSITFEITGAGKSDTATLTINVTPVNDPPVAGPDSVAGGFSEQLAIPTTMLLGNDTDPDTAASALVITEVTSGQHGTATMSGSNVMFSPETAFQGIANFSYTLSDGSLTATGSVTVTIGNNRSPVAVDDARSTPEETPTTITMASLLANDTDPDGNTLMINSVSSATHGTVSMAGTDVTFTPDANYSGPATFEYTVIDGIGQDTGLVTVTITPINDPPTAVVDVLSALEDQPRTIPQSELTLNDTDPDGDNLNVTEVSLATNGTVALSAGVVTFTPADDFVGVTGFTYTVSDGTATSSAQVVINIVGSGDPPIAVDDTRSTVEDTVTSFAASVLALNDINPDGGGLTVIAVSNASNGMVSLSNGTITFTPDVDFAGVAGFDYTIMSSNGSDIGHVVVNVSPINDPPNARDDVIAANEDIPVGIDVLANDTDAEGTAVTIQSFGQPANGVTVTFGNGIRYTPAADFNGTDSFTYVARDATGLTDTATVTISVEPINDPPAAVVDFATTNEDVVITINPRANDFDVDGDPISLLSLTQPAHGVTAIIGGNARYTPAPNYFGTDLYTYTIADGHGATSVGTVMVTVLSQPDPAIAVADSFSMLDANVTLSGNVIPNDLNIEGGEIVEIWSYPDGDLTMNDDGTFTYDPYDDCEQFDSFEYRILDNGQYSNIVTVSISINHVPEVGSMFVSVLMNGSFSYFIWNAFDSDDDTLTFTIVAPPQHALVFDFDTDNGDYYYEPVIGYTGPDQFTVAVSDGIGPAQNATVFIDVYDSGGYVFSGPGTAGGNDEFAFAEALTESFMDEIYGTKSCCSLKQSLGADVIAGGKKCDLRPAPAITDLGDLDTWY